MKARAIELGDDLIILGCRFDWSEREVDRMIDRARKHKALIVDLRGNPGGRVETLKYVS